MVLRKDEEWLRERAQKTGLGYTDAGKRVQPGQLLKPAPPESPKQQDQKQGEKPPRARPRPEPGYQCTDAGIHILTVIPMSVNEAWKGRRFKTDQYRYYEYECSMLLPRNIDLPDGPLEIFFQWGFSSQQADYDNPVKPFQDILQKQFGFDDRRIFDSHIGKRLVKPGHEYIKFKIVPASMTSIFD